MGYSPTIPPQNSDNLSEYVYSELLQISSVLRMVEEGRFLPVLSTEPGKPREGMVAIAWGEPHWNPGAGKGLYEFRNGVWEKL